VSAKKNEAEPRIPATEAELWALVRRAEKGDAKTVPVLRKLLSEPSDLVEWLGGNLALQAERTIIKDAGAENLAFKEALTRKMELLRQELAGPKPTPLESLLAERIALCWLSIHLVEIRFEQYAKDLSMRQAVHWQDRIDRAHRRYLSAIRTLATVRKLAVVVQVNIARKQVNVAGAPVPVDEGDRKHLPTIERN
jgi:hypothetical protein